MYTRRMADDGPKFADRESAGTPAPKPAGPAVYEMGVDAVREVDRLAVERYGIPGVVLMENAGRGLVPEALRLLGDDTQVAILCGPGNNGGDGLVLARHLTNAMNRAGETPRVTVVLPAEPTTPDARTNLHIVRAMGLGLVDGVDALEQGARFGLVVDALFGTGLSRPIGGVFEGLVRWMAAQRVGGARVLAVDVPSGLDADSGGVVGSEGGVCVSADATVTLAAIKPGLEALEAQSRVGDLSVAGIGVPNRLLEELGRRRPPAAGRGR